MNIKNILILGSKGQIGLALREHLIKKKFNVFDFDLVDGENFDLRKQNILDNILPNIDFVFFLAFDVGGSKYLSENENKYEFINNNIKIMSYTFDSLKKFNIPFIFTSSQMSNMTYSSYGVLKSIGEYYTKSLNGIVVKFWNVYGIENDESKSHVITDFIKMAKKNKIIEIRTSGTEKRQFLHSNDCSKALETIMQKYNKIDKNKILDITSFEWISIIEIAEIISKINQCSYKTGIKEDIQKNKQNKPNNYILNFWKPEISIFDGIKQINDTINI